MKKYLFLMLLLIPCLAKASEPTTLDDDKWIGTVEFNPAVIGLEKGSKANFSLGLSASRKVYDYLSIGGIISLNEGWEFKQAPILDIMARMHFEDFTKSFTPYLDFDLGYEQSLAFTSYRGFVFAPTIGIRYGCLGAGFGYKGLVYNGNIKNALTLKLLYFFGYHHSDAASIFFSRTDFSLGVSGIFSGGRKHVGETGYISANTGASLDLSWLYNLNDNFALGLFAGLNVLSGKLKYYNWDDNTSFAAAVYGLRAKYKIKQFNLPLGLYPFVKFDIGAASNLDDYHPVTFYYSPGIGISLPFKNDSHSIDLGVSYAPVSMKSYKRTYDDKHGDVGSVRVSLGYTF